VSLDACLTGRPALGLAAGSAQADVAHYVREVSALDGKPTAGVRAFISREPYSMLLFSFRQICAAWSGQAR